MNLFKKKSSIPKLHWKDITIARHKAILKVYEKYRGDEDNLAFLYDLCAAAYGKDEEWINGLQISEANEWVNSMAFLNERLKPAMVKSEYWLGGHRYKLTMNFQEVSTLQYIEFQQMAEHSADMPAEFLSIILIPYGKTYGEGYDISQVVYDIENYMSVEDCLGMRAFFLTLLKISTRRSLRKLGKLEAKARKEGLMSEEQLQALHRVRVLLESVSGTKRSTP